jgi:hypothetical protein
MKKEFSWRWGVVAAVMAGLLVLAGCGGGGGGASVSSNVSPGAPVGPATVEISFAAASTTGSAAVPIMVAGATTVPSADPAFEWPDRVTEPSPKIAHVYMDVVKISLMPAYEEFEGEDMEGEIRDGDSPDPSGLPDKPHFVTIVPDKPICIDLLKLENGKRLARFFKKFDHVPAGTYDKIRVYYRNVVVVLNDEARTEVRFHPTAHSKFDIHFRERHELVIPATTDTTQPDGWVKFFRVKLDVVGLKLKIVAGGKNWKGSKVILRPQIFAEFVPPILYSVAGTATEVIKVATLPVSGTFDVSFGTGLGYPRVISAAFDNDTTWAYSDNVLGHSSWIVDVPNTTAVPAFDNRAIVQVIGTFDPALVIRARDIVFSFPDEKSGEVDNTWRLDNTFVLRLAADNVVYPKPDRFTAYYDNSVTRLPLTHEAIDNNVHVKARGYNVTGPIPPGGIEAYWISVGPFF